ncbi:MAG: hypothetical protein QM736_27815 [Vicinamibacterales bacterium]
MRTRELHRGNSDAAARAVHEHCFRGTRLRAPEERVVRRRVRNADGRTLLIRHLSGQTMQLRRLAECLLGAQPGARAAEVVARDEDAVARLERADVRADGDDVARAVSARRVRQRRLVGVYAAANVRVDRIHADSTHAHQHLRRRRRQIRDVLDLHHIGCTELADDD